MTGSFIHPAAWFIGLALILPFLRGGFWWRWLLPIPAIAAFISVVTADHGLYGYIPYLGQFLILGRVDRLSLVFANVFAIQAFIGIIYAFHVKEKAHHIASLLYVAGSFGCTFAGDYITLFVFWELMSVSSTFLIWLRRVFTTVPVVISVVPKSVLSEFVGVVSPSTMVVALPCIFISGAILVPVP